MFAWENSEFCQRQGTTLTNDYTVLGLILPSNAPLLYLTFDPLLLDQYYVQT